MPVRNVLDPEHDVSSSNFQHARHGFHFERWSSSTLGQGKLQLGPTILLLIQPGKWTLGVLANNTWSVAGKE
jgi:hypothetical protein